MKNNYPKCGELYWIELDPAIGTETKKKKKRPCLIVSNNAYNKYSTRVIAPPITSQIKSVHPCDIAVQVSGRPGKIMLDQIRSFDKQRLRGKLWELDASVMEQVGCTFKNLFDFL